MDECWSVEAVRLRGEAGGEDGVEGEVLHAGAPVAGGEILAVFVSVQTLTGPHHLGGKVRGGRGDVQIQTWLMPQSGDCMTRCQAPSLLLTQPGFTSRVCVEHMK